MFFTNGKYKVIFGTIYHDNVMELYIHDNNVALTGIKLCFKDGLCFYIECCVAGCRRRVYMYP